MNKTKKSIAIFMVLAMLLTLLACSTKPATSTSSANTAPKEGTSATAEPKAETEAKKKYMISLGSGANGGTFYILGSGIGSLVEKYNDNITVAVEATGASVENTKLIGSKQVDLVLSNPSEVANALAGIRDYEGMAMNNLRMIAAGPIMQCHLIVRADSNIKSLEDLVNKRVSTGPGGSAQQLCAYNVLSVADITSDQIQEKNLTINDAVSAMKDGSLDAILYNGTAPVAALIDLCSSIDVRFIGFDDAQIEKMLKLHPEFVASSIKAGTYNGQNEDIKCCGLATLFITNDSADEDLIYAVTKTLFEHTAELAEIHKTGAEFSIDNPALMLDLIPFHPGAEKYLKEIGVIH